jgi:glycerophosphoryl diester phosphodiesterase
VLRDGAALSRIVCDLKATWPQLAITDILYKVVGFVILTPLTAALVRVVVSMSGRTVLADQEILFFFMRPLGWVSLILIGGITLAIIGLEQAALMSIVLGERLRLQVDFWKALVFVAGRAWAVLQVTAKLVARALLIAAPFLVAAALTYMALLTKHDINFYLAEKPPEFLWALGIAGVLIVVLVILLARRLIGWAFSLPLVIFGGVLPREALEESRAMISGNQQRITRWLIGWAVASFIVSTGLTSAVLLMGRTVIPRLTGALPFFVVALGLTLLAWGLVNIVTTLISAAVFAILIVDLYETMGGGSSVLESALQTKEEGGLSKDLRFSRGFALSAAAVGLIASAGVAFVLLQRASIEDKVEITAHRGAAMHAPENTVAAVEAALEAAADWVEIDVQETADGEVVVLHDSDLKKVAGVDLKIWDATWEDLQDIDVGSFFSPEFSDQRIPKLQKILELCRGKAGVVIELKYYGHQVRLEERVAEVVDGLGMASDIKVMSLDYDGLERMKALRPEWKMGYLTSVVMGDLTRMDVDFLAVNSGMASRRFVRATQNAGKGVFTWTVNDVLGMSAMMDLGVDSIITDDPQLAREVLAHRAEMNPVERLLAGLAVYFGGVKETSEENA